MEHEFTQFFIVLALGGMLAQWLAWRLRLPAIVLLILVGLLVGPVFGWIHPSAQFGDTLPALIGVAVAIILFEGGLNLHFHELREAGAGVRRLVTLGLAFNFALGSLAAHYIGGLDWPVALVFGAIIVVTGPTVIIPLLRHARLRQKSAAILKWEGIVNDPFGALFAVLIYEYFTLQQGGAAGSAILGGVFLSLSVSLLLGLTLGYALAWSYRRGMVPEYLKGPGVFAAAVLVYAMTNLAHEEAGLLGATILGIVIGNQKLPSIEEIRRFKEYITILLVTGLFIILTANIDAQMLAALDWRALALILSIVFVVRPVATLLATWGAGMDWRDRVLVAWIAPRGIVAAAVAAAFAPGLVNAGYQQGELLVPLVFGLILVTVVLHGGTIGLLSRQLGLASEKSNGLLIAGSSAWSVDLAKQLQSLELPVRIVDNSWHRLRIARLENLPIYYGHPISEAAEMNLEINDIGYLLAATDNDAYNALVCSWFASDLSRHGVYQLPLLGSDHESPRNIIQGVRGRKAFGDEAIFEELLKLYFEGWRFRKTRLSDNYDYSQYRQDSGDTNVATLAVRKNGELLLHLDESTELEAGDVVINFLPDRSPAGLESAGSASTDATAQAGQTPDEKLADIQDPT